MRNSIKIKKIDNSKTVDNFSDVVVGDIITVSKGGKIYRNVKVKGNTGRGPVRRWVSSHKVGMRWAPKGVGIMQLQIEGFLLLDVIHSS